MLDMLIKLLTPILGELSVSPADVEIYVHSCASYIYAILAVIVIGIIAMVAVHWVVKKGTRHVVRWGTGVAMLLAIVLIANLVCYGPLKSNLYTVLNGGASVSDESLAASKQIVARIGEEGIVLAKNNDNLLPLTSQKNLNVFGWASTNPIYGGTGSGGGVGDANITLLQGLANAGFNTNADLTQMYTDYCADRNVKQGVGGQQDLTLPEPTMDYYTDAVMSQAAEFSDVALIVISRGGGEGYDLPTDMNAVIHGTYDLASSVSLVPESYTYTNLVYENNGNYDDFEPGEHYLELSVTEENLVDKVCSEFNKVVVVVNANNTMELGWVDDYPQIKSVILTPGPGVSGFDGLGKILSGEVNPSGRTADTFVKDLTSTPYFNNIGSFFYENVNDLCQANLAADAAFEGCMSFVNCVESIYVGYKFYETAYDEGMSGFDYDSMVQYPFGHGLSYTTFTQSIKNFSDNGDTVTFEVEVTNTGSVAGKDVVEVYFTPPYTNGGIEKASVNLVQYSKTDLLSAGASETIPFSIPKEDMASYDERGVKVNGGGYVLEAGEYTISIRSNSHTVLDSVAFTVDSDVRGRSTDGIAATNVFQSYSAGDVTYLSRADAFANYSVATNAPAASAHQMSAETRAIIEKYTFATYDSASWDNPNDSMPTMDARNGLTLANLTGKSYDDPDWDKLLDQLSWDDMVLMVNLGGWQTAAIDSVGKVATADSDGPAGLFNFVAGTFGSQFCTETLMAQTWNPKLANELGKAMGQEFIDVGQYGCYGPAMNTHRSAFAGRNFEYYSEDGVLAGQFAAAETNGLGSLGIYPYIKHFATNDQETNRNAFLCTYNTEQAIREIYTKPFELCVKGYEYPQMGIMSAFNFIGPVPVCSNRDLLVTVLREEWGFNGMVITDYDGSYGYMVTDCCVRNGGDLMLGFNRYDSNKITNQSATMANALRQSCKNIMYTIGNSGYYTNAEGNGGMDNMARLFVTIDVLAVVISVAVMTAVIILWRKKTVSKT